MTTEARKLALAGSWLREEATRLNEFAAATVAASPTDAVAIQVASRMTDAARRLCPERHLATEALRSFVMYVRKQRHWAQRADDEGQRHGGNERALSLSYGENASREWRSREAAIARMRSFGWLP